MPTAAAELKAQTMALFTQYRKQRSLALEDQIFKLNEGLVRRIAGKFAGKGQGDYPDLYQIGAIGLTKAIRAFNLERGTAFSTFAVPYIRGEIQHSRRHRAIKVERRWNDAFPTLRRLRDAGASLQEMADALNQRKGKRWAVEEVREALTAYQHPDPDSLDRPRAEDGDPWELPDSTVHTTRWEDEMGLSLQRREDDMVNATAICRHYGRRFSDYWCSRRCAKLLETLEKSRNQKARFRPDAEPAPLFDIRRGGRAGGGESWVCEEIAIDLLTWCDPAMVVAVHALVVQRLSA